MLVIKSLKRLLRYAYEMVLCIFIHPSIRSINTGILDFFQWWKYLSPNHNPMTDEIPWIPFAVTRFIKKRLNKDSLVYEVGSGGSTLFWAKNSKEVISIEHDEKWYDTIQNILNLRKYENVIYQLIKPDEDIDFYNRTPSHPTDYISDRKEFAGMNFKSYALNIDKYSTEYFDFILIDGRARPSCLYHALFRVKKNGYIILDNSARPHYLKEIEELKDKKRWKQMIFFGPTPYYGRFTQATVFKRLE